jgi:DNA polymerase
MDAETASQNLHFANHAQLVAALESLTGDPLEAAGGNICICRGNPQADLMIIGEGPGAQEDRQRKPFVGPSGQLLDQILQAAGFNPETDVYITNTVKRRPPRNRDPQPDELAYYAPYLFEEIRLVDPKIIMLTGKYAMTVILGEKRGITKVRGTWYEQDGRWVIPVFHPAYLLRNPQKTPGSPKALMWQDIQTIRAKYEELK